jgi:hypothetical protein
MSKKELSFKEGYEVLILDSLSHGWQELLEEIEKLAKSKYNGNTFRAWAEGTSKQRKLTHAIIHAPIHIIATMRVKTEWVIETNEKGKSAPRKIGLTPEQGKGIEYEFDMLMEIDQTHTAIVTKDRSGKFQDTDIHKPNADFGRELAQWLNDGIEAPAPVQTQEPETTADKCAVILAEIEQIMPIKSLSGDEDGMYREWIENAVKVGDFVSLQNVLNRIKAKQPAKPTATELQVSCSNLLKELIAKSIDSYGDETRRHNSFLKHLGPDTLKECQDVDKLTTYLSHLQSKLNPVADIFDKPAETGTLSKTALALETEKRKAIDHINALPLDESMGEHYRNQITKAKTLKAVADIMTEVKETT